MGLIIRDYENDLLEVATTFRPNEPIAGLAYLNFFTGEGAGQRNLAPGGEESAVVGSPIAEESFWTFDGLADFIQTAVVEPGPFSIWAVGRTDDTLADFAGRPAYVSSWNGGGDPGLNLYQQLATTTQGGSARDNGGVPQQVTASLPIDDATAWNFFEWKGDLTTTSLFSYTKGGSRIVATPGGNRLSSGRLMRIGSAYTQLAGRCDVAFAAIATQANTDAVGAALYAQVKAALGPRGIAI